MSIVLINNFPDKRNLWWPSALQLLICPLQIHPDSCPPNPNPHFTPQNICPGSFFESSPACCSIQLLWPSSKQTKHPRVMRPPLGIPRWKEPRVLMWDWPLFKEGNEKDGRREIWEEELWSDGVDWAVGCLIEKSDKTAIGDSGYEITTFRSLSGAFPHWTQQDGGVGSCDHPDPPQAKMNLCNLKLRNKISLKTA